MPVDSKDEEDYERLVGRPRRAPTEPERPVVADERAAKEQRAEWQRRNRLRREHGAASDQGRARLHGGSTPDVREGPEEGHQQRRED